MIDIRVATVEDLPRIHEVWWAADPFEAGNDNPWFGHVLRTGTMAVAMVEGRLVGFAGVREVGETIVVSDCFVEPEHQARGIGRSLLTRLLPGDSPVMTMASRGPEGAIAVLPVRHGTEVGLSLSLRRSRPSRSRIITRSGSDRLPGGRFRLGTST